MAKRRRKSKLKSPFSKGWASRLAKKMSSPPRRKRKKKGRRKGLL